MSAFTVLLILAISGVFGKEIQESALNLCMGILVLAILIIICIAVVNLFHIVLGAFGSASIGYFLI